MILNMILPPAILLRLLLCPWTWGIFLWWDLTFSSVMVCAWVGKEFPDVRQNEREIHFIRLGDAVITAGQLKGEPTLNRSP